MVCDILQRNYYDQLFARVSVTKQNDQIYIIDWISTATKFAAIGIDKHLNSVTIPTNITPGLFVAVKNRKHISVLVDFINVISITIHIDSININNGFTFDSPSSSTDYTLYKISTNSFQQTFDLHTLISNNAALFDKLKLPAMWNLNSFIAIETRLPFITKIYTNTDIITTRANLFKHPVFIYKIFAHLNVDLVTNKISSIQFNDIKFQNTNESVLIESALNHLISQTRAYYFTGINSTTTLRHLLNKSVLYRNKYVHLFYIDKKKITFGLNMIHIDLSILMVQLQYTPANNNPHAIWNLIEVDKLLYDQNFEYNTPTSHRIAHESFIFALAKCNTFLILNKHDIQTPGNNVIVRPSINVLNNNRRFVGGLNYIHNSGFYNNVHTYDFEAYYPNLIVNHNISPETVCILTVSQLRNATNGITLNNNDFECYEFISHNNLYTQSIRKSVPQKKINNILNIITSTNNQLYLIIDKRKIGILTKYTQFKLAQRTESKEQLQQNPTDLSELTYNRHKLETSTIYGLLGAKFGALSSLHTAATVTFLGRHHLIELAHQNITHQCIFADTDSLFFSHSTIKWTPQISMKHTHLKKILILSKKSYIATTINKNKIIARGTGPIKWKPLAIYAYKMKVPVNCSFTQFCYIAWRRIYKKTVKLLTKNNNLLTNHTTFKISYINITEKILIPFDKLEIDKINLYTLLAPIHKVIFKILHHIYIKYLKSKLQISWRYSFQRCDNQAILAFISHINV
jgi:hypothetical protein